MVRMFSQSFAVVAIALGMTGLGFGADDPKAKSAPSSPPSTTPADPAPLYIISGDLVGEVMKVDDKSITIRVTWYTLKPAKGARNQYGNWHRGSMGRSPQAMFQHMVQMQQMMMRRAASAKAVQHHQDYVLSFTPDASARIKHLPPKLDDSGKKTFYTSDELLKLKGNPTIPGYIAELSELKKGQIVEAHMVHITRQKENFVRWALILNDPQGAGQNNGTTPGSGSTSNLKN